MELNNYLKANFPIPSFSIIGISFTKFPYYHEWCEYYKKNYSSVGDLTKYIEFYSMMEWKKYSTFHNKKDDEFCFLDHCIKLHWIKNSTQNYICSANPPYSKINYYGNNVMIVILAVDDNINELTTIFCCIICENKQHFFRLCSVGRLGYINLSMFLEKELCFVDITNSIDNMRILDVSKDHIINSNYLMDSRKSFEIKIDIYSILDLCIKKKFDAYKCITNFNDITILFNKF